MEGDTIKLTSSMENKTKSYQFHCSSHLPATHLIDWTRHLLQCNGTRSGGSLPLTRVIIPSVNMSSSSTQRGHSSTHHNNSDVLLKVIVCAPGRSAGRALSLSTALLGRVFSPGHLVEMNSISPGHLTGISSFFSWPLNRDEPFLSRSLGREELSLLAARPRLHPFLSWSLGRDERFLSRSFSQDEPLLLLATRSGSAFSLCRSIGTCSFSPGGSIGKGLLEQ